jgi:hypothetical protein
MTGTLADKHGRVPDTVTITHVRRGDGIAFVECHEPLATSWLEHPDHGKKVDVAALPLTSLDDVYLSGYDPWRPSHVQLGVGDDVTVVGFPFGVGSGGFALWTRGAIASEYDVDYQDLPRFLIDGRMRPGQSGSPVIFFQTGAYFGKFGDVVMVPMTPEHIPNAGMPISPGQATPDDSGFTEEFLGVYSGRIHRESDLGFVWRPSTVREILEGGVFAQTR